MQIFVNVSCPLPHCPEVTQVAVDAQQYANWGAGELIQNAMPTLGATEREVLISGVCPACQVRVFGEEE